MVTRNQKEARIQGSKSTTENMCPSFHPRGDVLKGEVAKETVGLREGLEVIRRR